MDWRGKRESARDFKKLLAFGEAPSLYFDAGPALNKFADYFCPRAVPGRSRDRGLVCVAEARLSMALI
jgi:hypothetical protein